MGGRGPFYGPERRSQAISDAFPVAWRGFELRADRGLPGKEPLHAVRLAPADDLLIGDPTPTALFDWSVYNRGAMTLHALRARVGDEAFFDTLRTYTARFHDGNVTTEDFIAVAEEVSGQELDDLFWAWLLETEVPDIPELGWYRDDFPNVPRSKAVALARVIGWAAWLCGRVEIDL